MNKSIKMLGVTLLEVMLVLAVAAIVILTSIRFYKSATDSSQVNAIIQTVQAITSAADGLAQNTGSYTAATQTAITDVAGSSVLRAPWGATITITSTATTMTMTFSVAPGTSVCTQMKTKLEASPKFTVPAGCASVTYTSTN